MLLRDVADNCTVVGIPGRVIHQAGTRVNPLAHSALPDAEAQVIRNLMERIDALETELQRLQNSVTSMASGNPLSSNQDCGAAQNLRDREILEFLGEAQHDEAEHA